MNLKQMILVLSFLMFLIVPSINAETCFLDSEPTVDEGVEKFVVRDITGAPIGYLVLNSGSYSAYSEASGWLEENFVSVDSAAIAICDE